MICSHKKLKFIEDTKTHTISLCLDCGEKLLRTEGWLPLGKEVRKFGLGKTEENLQVGGQEERKKVSLREIKRMLKKEV